MIKNLHTPAMVVVFFANACAPSVQSNALSCDDVEQRHASDETLIKKRVAELNAKKDTLVGHEEFLKLQNQLEAYQNRYQVDMRDCKAQQK